MEHLVADWGWVNQRRPSGMLWVKGTLQESYETVSRKPGQWILRSANPVSAYHRVMAETAKMDGA
jgi:hypothetical protein